MNCRDLIARLEDYVAGRLRPSERREAKAHLAVCGECREVETLIAAAATGQGLEAPPGLLADVLSRTSGGTCDSAHGLLCDHVDGTIDTVDDELLRLHLNDCHGCAGLALALTQMTSDMPAVAELRPDEGFVADVLARTSRRESLVAGWSVRLKEGWQRMMQRPRFAFEGAYLGLIIMVLLFGIPSSPLAGVPQQALGLVRSNPVAGLREAGEKVAPRIRITLKPQWEDKGAELAGATREIADDIARRSRSRFEQWKTELGTLWERLTSEETKDETNGTADGADPIEGEDE